MSRAVAILSGIALFFLYFFGLTRTGLLGPDEPRYAAIGRAMAATGDWITPRLWGVPWFEKPALLYWMTATGFQAGLGPGLAPRLPVALASLAFLIYFFTILRREFGARAAWYSAAILATSVGWLAYSRIGVTDLPMSAAFAAAMFALPLADARSSVRASLATGALLGLAVLAKGLVPLALFLPALWFLRHRIRDLALVFGAAALVAAPWYLMVTLRNGRPFLEEFFWKHHFSRFLNGALQHEQPIWFYVPVLLAGLVPWTPLLGLLGSRGFYQDCRTRFFLVWFAWGFLFFSVSRNKLPGYLLPLFPALAALLGIALANAESRGRTLLATCGVLLSIVPMLAGILPHALLSGLSHVSYKPAWAWIAGGVGLAIGCWLLDRGGRRDAAVALVTIAAVLCVVEVAWRVYPQLDRQVSGRVTWLNSGQSMTCLPPTNRSQRYSIDYYAEKDLPDCK